MQVKSSILVLELLNYPEDAKLYQIRPDAVFLLDGVLSNELYDMPWFNLTIGKLKELVLKELGETNV